MKVTPYVIKEMTFKLKTTGKSHVDYRGSQIRSSAVFPI